MVTGAYKKWLLLSVILYGNTNSVSRLVGEDILSQVHSAIQSEYHEFVDQSNKQKKDWSILERYTSMFVDDDNAEMAHVSMEKMNERKVLKLNQVYKSVKLERFGQLPSDFIENVIITNEKNSFNGKLVHRPRDESGSANDDILEFNDDSDISSAKIDLLDKSLDESIIICEQMDKVGRLSVKGSKFIKGIKALQTRASRNRDTSMMEDMIVDDEQMGTGHLRSRRYHVYKGLFAKKRVRASDRSDDEKSDLSDEDTTMT